jgi:hypothetical protein
MNWRMDLVKNGYNTNITDTWCMDIKYINTYEGFVYVNIVRNFCTQAILVLYQWQNGYEDIVLPSLNMALCRAQKLEMALNNLIIHTDNGNNTIVKASRNLQLNCTSN